MQWKLKAGGFYHSYLFTPAFLVLTLLFVFSNLWTHAIKRAGVWGGHRLPHSPTWVKGSQVSSNRWSPNRPTHLCTASREANIHQHSPSACTAERPLSTASRWRGISASTSQVCGARIRRLPCDLLIFCLMTSGASSVWFKFHLIVH